ncbi:MAG: hypothetical protein DIJKHBIC_04393 [Thermoanaerobaculia bacterium]|nr:hypothetical protein [Thermoanaerobaculia bacterium]
MSKKRQREEEKRLEAVLDALLPDVESLSEPEVDRLHEDGACDLADIRRRLHTMANEVAAGHRRAGHAAPKALTAFAEAMDDSPRLPRDPAAALAKAARFVKALGQAVVPPVGGLRVVEAYRKGDAELTERDRAALDEAADTLRQEPEKNDKG